MDLIEDEKRKIDKFFEKMNNNDFDNMLVRNGISNSEDIKEEDILFYLDFLKRRVENKVN